MANTADIILSESRLFSGIQVRPYVSLAQAFRIDIGDQIGDYHAVYYPDPDRDPDSTVADEFDAIHSPLDNRLTEYRLEHGL